MPMALFGARIEGESCIRIGEVWEVNGFAWKVVKVIPRNRITLKQLGRIEERRPLLPWWRRLFGWVVRR